MTQGGLQEDRCQRYASLIIGLITMWIAWTLHFAETWSFFTRRTRVFLTSYNSIIAVALGTAFSYLPGVDLSDEDQVGIERVNVKAPWDWQPTADRKWIVNPLEDIDGMGIAAAFVPGLMFFLLFIIDHNVSSIMTQKPKYNLKKPPVLRSSPVRCWVFHRGTVSSHRLRFIRKRCVPEDTWSMTTVSNGKSSFIAKNSDGRVSDRHF